jgi:hypothetical protein
MDSSKLAIKFFANDGSSSVKPEALVPIFHKWIQTQALPDHLLIDVADYKHVHTGPGTVLVAHEANLSADSGDHRFGLLYVRKAPIEGNLGAKLAAVFRAGLTACQLLEREPEIGISFRTDNPLFRIHDRLLAPNDAETFASVRPELESFLTKLYRGPVKLGHSAGTETLFQLAISAPSSPGVGELLGRL